MRSARWVDVVLLSASAFVAGVALQVSFKILPPGEPRAPLELGDADPAMATKAQPVLVGRQTEPSPSDDATVTRGNGEPSASRAESTSQVEAWRPLDLMDAPLREVAPAEYARLIAPVRQRPLMYGQGEPMPTLLGRDFPQAEWLEGELRDVAARFIDRRGPPIIAADMYLVAGISGSQGSEQYDVNVGMLPAVDEATAEWQLAQLVRQLGVPASAVREGSVQRQDGLSIAAEYLRERHRYRVREQQRLARHMRGDIRSEAVMTGGVFIVPRSGEGLFIIGAESDVELGQLVCAFARAAGDLRSELNGMFRR